MDQDINNIVISPDELKADEEVVKVVTDDELKSKVAEEFGLNPDTDAEMLEKLVAKEKSHHEKLSAAIKQKISWRDKVTTKKPDGKGGTLNPEDVGTLVDQKVRETLESRDLESLTVSDEIKAEIKDFAKAKNISVREAAQLPYIKFKIEEAEKATRINNASPNRTNKGGKTISVDASKPLNPEDFDFNTEEGRKAWTDAKSARQQYRANH